MPITPKPRADTLKAAFPVPNTRCPLIRATTVSSFRDVSGCFGSTAKTLSSPAGIANAAPAKAAVLRNPRRLMFILLSSFMVLRFCD
ncbi:hypothetical protein NE636_02170 [Bacteroides thetaiotaomicron]|nr:hypothetical protein [Bacteroides thetaiotaomicron]MCQ5247615.1 hypothetical protein [Bacteroides thetaiotaomicron]